MMCKIVNGEGVFSPRVTANSITVSQFMVCIQLIHVCFIKLFGFNLILIRKQSEWRMAQMEPQGYSTAYA